MTTATSESPPAVSSVDGCYWNIRPKIGTVVVPDTVLRPAANPDPNIYNTIKQDYTDEEVDKICKLRVEVIEKG